MQVVIDKISKKVSSNSNANINISSIESLKSSIDYLTHYLMTANIDIMQKEAKLKKY